MAINDIYLHNTLTGTKDLFKPITAGKIGIYSCGPTVYDRIHIGNIRAYVFPDVLRRFLIQQGNEVTLVRNITDVDDKTIKSSQQEGVSLKELTQKYETIFFDDLARLNIEQANFSPRATEHIDDMVAIIKILLDKGLAYSAKDGIYFSISKSKNYGNLVGLKIDSTKQEARIANDEYDKENPQDFALWKFWTPADGEVFWQTDIGKGRPGWHIECSAMSVKYLGQPFDIHTGGVDLIFPHHTNEIAQSEGVTDGEPLANYFLHNGHIMIENAKMAKSAGNFITLADIEAKGISPLSYRYWLLTAHYRTLANFTWEALAGADQAMKRLVNALAEIIETDGRSDASFLQKSAEALSDDLNTSKVLALIWEILKNSTLREADKKATIFEIDAILGLNLKKQVEDLSSRSVEAPEEVKHLLSERENARKEANWDESDSIRQKISELGWKIEDGPTGPELSPL